VCGHAGFAFPRSSASQHCIAEPPNDTARTSRARWPPSRRVHPTSTHNSVPTPSRETPRSCTLAKDSQRLPLDQQLPARPLASSAAFLATSPLLLFPRLPLFHTLLPAPCRLSLHPLSPRPFQRRRVRRILASLLLPPPLEPLKSLDDFAANPRRSSPSKSQATVQSACGRRRSLRRRSGHEDGQCTARTCGRRPVRLPHPTLHLAQHLAVPLSLLSTRMKAKSSSPSSSRLSGAVPPSPLPPHSQETPPSRLD
jgi:hypothetical protein